MPIKFLVLGGGGVFWVLGGGEGKCQFYFYGRWHFSEREGAILITTQRFSVQICLRGSVCPLILSLRAP